MKKNSINEDMGGDIGGMDIDYGMAGGSGGGWGYDPFPKGDLIKIFTEPFLDLAKVSYASMKNVANKTRTLVEKTLSFAASMLIPFIQADYKALNDAEAVRAEKIQSEYKHVFDRVDRFIATNHDLHGVAFMLAPGMFLSKKYVLPMAKSITKETAGAIIQVVMTLVPTGYSKKRAKMTAEVINGNSSGAKKLIEDEDDKKYYASLLSAASVTEGALNEKDSEAQNKKRLAAILGVFLDDSVIKSELASGEKSKKMREDAKKIVSKTLLDVLQLNKKYASVKSIDDINRLTGKKIIDDSTLASMDEQERAAAVKTITTQIVKGSRLASKNMVRLKLLKLEKCGLEDNHPLVVAYKNVLDKI